MKTSIATLFMLWATLSSSSQIINLEVEDFEMGNLLSWKTQNEDKIQEFVVEKSKNGIDFERAGSVKSKKQPSGVIEYSFLDAAATKGTTSYRLKQVNSDSSFEFSKTVHVNKTSENNFTVISMSPLETVNSVEIVLEVRKALEVTYFLEKQKAGKIYTSTQYLNEGLNIITVDVSGLELGTYRITLQGGKEYETLTFKTFEKKNVKTFADFDDSGKKND